MSRIYKLIHDRLTKTEILNKNYLTTSSVPKEAAQCKAVFLVSAASIESTGTPHDII